MAVAPSELHENNYRRITMINWALSFPLLLIFSWPYYFICELAGIEKIIGYTGSLIFALPFVITILHGHVTMALGSLHRHHYYNWLINYPLTYGLLFHEILISTRFRLVLLIVSLLLIPFGFYYSG